MSAQPESVQSNPQEDLQTRRPLEGVRILAAEQMQALPFATQLLAHMGADVVKVENPESGESARGALPAVADIDGNQVGATYLRNSLNKQSICLDLKNPEGKELFKRLVPHFDVVGENFRPGTMDRLGLGYDVLSEIHPGLVYVSVSGFGNLRESPYSKWPAYACVAEAMAGFMESARQTDEEPKLGAAGALGDIGSSLFAAIGTLAALRERDRTGRGQHVDIAMFDAMISMADVVPFFWSMGVRGKERRAAGVVSSFRAKDGYFVLQAVREHHLALLARAIGHPEWLEDERFATRLGWGDRLDDVVRPAIEEWASDKTKLEVCAELCGQGIASGPCNTPEDLIHDEHVRDHNMILEIPRPDSEDPLLIVGNPIKFSETPEHPSRRWPTLGEHTDEILRTDLNLSEEEISGLRARGVTASS
ncbi:CoA transferase [Myxococcota bacterium]|nr:CoA transferase [Myxococcota bacterium]